MSCHHAINGRTWGFVFFLDRLALTLDFMSFFLFLRTRSHDFLTGNWHDNSIYLHSTEKKHTLKKNQGSERKKKRRERPQSSRYIDLHEILRCKWEWPANWPRSQQQYYYTHGSSLRSKHFFCVVVFMWEVYSFHDLVWKNSPIFLISI